MKRRKENHRDRVELWHKHLENKTKPEDSKVIVTLVPGFAFSPSRDIAKAIHTDVFLNAQDARKAVKAAEPCTCDRCACPNTKGRV